MKEKCLICYGKKELISLECNHKYCEECISEWYRKKEICPYCMKTIKSDSNPIFYNINKIKYIRTIIYIRIIFFMTIIYTYHIYNIYNKSCDIKNECNLKLTNIIIDSNYIPKIIYDFINSSPIPKTMVDFIQPMICDIICIFYKNRFLFNFNVFDPIVFIVNIIFTLIDDIILIHLYIYYKMFIITIKIWVIIMYILLS
jgi:hypothetical protein